MHFRTTEGPGRGARHSITRTSAHSGCAFIEMEIGRKKTRRLLLRLDEKDLLVLLYKIVDARSKVDTKRPLPHGGGSADKE